MTETDTGETPADTVVVRRSGGLAGTARTARLDLASDDRADRARALLDRIDLPSIAAAGTPAQPDRFVYSISTGSTSATIGESQLHGDVGALVKLVLDGS